MKTNIKLHSLLLLSSLFALTGCPGSGDRLKADETTTVNKVGSDICFLVPDAEDYQPTLIAINPRGTPPKNLSVTDMPDLAIQNGKLCIPPSFHQFPEEGQFIVQYILASKSDKDSRRSVVTGLEFSDGRVHNIPLTDQEITR
ncbi:putative T6SS immunity periplasmic lipoprotein [Winslowiella toletana]